MNVYPNFLDHQEKLKDFIKKLGEAVKLVLDNPITQTSPYLNSMYHGEEGE
jgi:hypothetical protein